jgi:predicted MFS family arabinose efflux permease
MLGVGEMLGGQIVGAIQDKVSNRAAIISEMIFLVSALTILLIFNENDYFTYRSAYLMCLTWGIQDSGLCNFLQCVLGFEFESKIIPFSVMKFT